VLCCFPVLLLLRLQDNVPHKALDLRQTS
jgi:hypothetical protein